MRELSFDYRFGHDDEYTVDIAATIEERKQAWALVYEKYREKGYAQSHPSRLWYSLHDALPETTTFLVRKHGCNVATLTLVPDSPLTIPADRLYGDELQALRSRGRRICEITSLVSDESNRRRCVEVLRHMFKVAYLAARRLDGATDFVITVNPRHTLYYEKKMLFERVGDVRTYDKVGGAPAALLRLDLTTAEIRYKELLGKDTLRCFVNPATEKRVLAWLRARRTRLNQSDVRTWFVNKRPLLFNAEPSVQEYVWSCCASA